MAYSFQNKASNVGVTVGELNEVLNNTPPYRVYTALLTQTGTDAPEAIVLENTIGDIWFTYQQSGIYIINSNNLFTEGKTVSPQDQTKCRVYGDFTLDYNIRMEFNNISYIGMSISNDDSEYIDNVLIYKFFEIRVYN